MSTVELVSLEDFEVLRGLIEGLRPEPRLSVSEWADAYRQLSPTASAMPGQWRTSFTPYLREIMDRLSSHDTCQEVVVKKGAQLGFTEAGFNWLGYIIDVSPAPTLFVGPTLEMMKRNSKIRLEPMIDASPRLRSKVKAARSRDSGNTLLQKDFPGGTVILTGANSAAGLRSMPISRLLLDEVDSFEANLDGEGSAVELATARTRTFANRKIYKNSTPTREGTSLIDAEFQTTDQRKYFVPCPHCGAAQVLKWEQMRWEKGRPETARYECEHCGGMMEERHKPEMLAAGFWQATAPENASPLRYGYHINALYSPLGWYAWEDAVRQYEKAENDDFALMTFVNTVLGEVWREKGEAPAWEAIYNRREMYTAQSLPKDIVFLTAGADVQKDRIELEIVGWARGKRSYSVDYRTIDGDTTHPSTWKKLDALLSEQWQREDGMQLPLRLLGVDTGYNTSHVYDFVRRHDPTRVIPMKGSDSLQIMYAPPKAVDHRRDGKRIGSMRIYHVGVSIIKSEIYGHLRLERDEDGQAPAGYCHFPQYAPPYFKGLTAERLESRMVRGYRRYQWVKVYERNEPLDCRVYARAAASVVGMDRFTEEHWQWMEASNLPPEQQASEASQDSPRRRRSGGWLNRD